MLEDGATLGSGLAISGTVNPLADDQSVSTNEDTAVNITLTGSDGNSESLTFAAVAGPASGSLGAITQINSTAASVTYTPGANATGPDSFTFEANDGGLDSPAATVSITISAVNDVPVANGQSVSTNEDTALPITLAGSDVEGSALTFLIQLQPENGTLATTDVNTTTTAGLTYTPDADFAGSDSFTFVANDGTVDSAAATISITISAVNNLPVANAQAVTVDEDDDVAIALTGSDADSDPLTFTVLTQPASGTLSGSAPNLTYEPNPDFDGSDSFTFLVNDGTDNSTAATVSITVNSVAEQDDDDDDDDNGSSGGGGGNRVVIVNNNNNNNQQGGSSVTTFPDSHFEENPLDRVGVSSPSFLDAGSISISQAGVGQQVSISATISNHQQEEREYAFIVQITDEQGSVVHVSWQQGTIEGGSMADVSTVWMPDAAGQYSARIFVWDGVGTLPDPLSQVTEMSITVL